MTLAVRWGRGPWIRADRGEAESWLWERVRAHWHRAAHPCRERGEPFWDCRQPLARCCQGGRLTRREGWRRYTVRRLPLLVSKRDREDRTVWRMSYENGAVTVDVPGMRVTSVWVNGQFYAPADPPPLFQARDGIGGPVVSPNGGMA